MAYRVNITVPFDCETCRHRFTISFKGVGPHTKIICPACGAIEYIPSEQVEALRDGLLKRAEDLPSNLEDQVWDAFDEDNELPVANIVDNGFGAKR